MSPLAPAGPSQRRVALVTLGCARNDVDAEELAGRLAADGWELVDEPAEAAVTLVNTCGFIEAAKKDSIDAVLEAADRKPAGGAVVAVGCLAERYGAELARELPEADAVLGYDDYSALSDRLTDVLAGRTHVSHAPRDRRTLLPLAPVERHAHAHVAAPAPVRPDDGAGTVPAAEVDAPVPASGPRLFRRRLSDAPWAPLKLASGCDRRCSFCAIPAFRGSYLSRSPEDVLAEARLLAGQGVRELFLVSENSTSYGKDLGDLRLLEGLLPQLTEVEGIVRVRVSYLQPAEMRPTLLDVLAGTPGVAPYFDLSFQHASGPVLRRMRRFGDTDRFLELLGQVRSRAPQAGVRSNVIVGFPGETEADLAELERFLTGAALDVVGVFGYSDEDGTEAAGYDGKLPEAEIAARVDRVSRLVEELVAQRAEERIGSTVEVLLESVDEDGVGEGRAAHQGPEVDGTTRVEWPAGAPHPAVGEIVRARVSAAIGADLLAEAR